MCLVQGWSFGNLASSRAPELSSKTLQKTLRMVEMTLKPRVLISFTKNMIGRTSQSDCDIAIYSASVVDIVTCDCNFDAQMTGHPA
jgi:hypothetical protein